MQYSVIIPVLNEQEYISLLLSDLLLQDRKPKEVLIVDAQSTDATRAVIQNHSLYKTGIARIISGKKPVGSQRSLGGFKATTELLIFLDADVRLKQATLSTLIDAFLRKNVDCACPLYFPASSDARSWCVYLLFNTLFVLGEKKFPSGAGSCIMVTKKLFSKLKGFRDDVLVDDYEFIRRAALQGQFALLKSPVYVSDRRFQKYGFLKTTAQYFRLSYYFLRGQYQKSNSEKYVFGEY